MVMQTIVMVQVLLFSNKVQRLFKVVILSVPIRMVQEHRSLNVPLSVWTVATVIKDASHEWLHIPKLFEVELYLLLYISFQVKSMSKLSSNEVRVRKVHLSTTLV